MNIEIKDEIPLGEPRYRIRDNNGNILQDNVSIEKTTPVKQEATPINKKLFQDLYNDVSSVGNIRLYSNIEDRPKALLCDGSAIFASDYPELRDKLNGYDVFEADDNVPSTGGVRKVNNIFWTAGTPMYYSYDGFEWFVTSAPEEFIDITYENGKYFAVGGGKCPVYYSEDFINWEFKQNLDSNSDISGEHILYKNGVLVVAGEYGLLQYSLDDGATFTVVIARQSTSISTTPHIYFLEYVNDTFVCDYVKGDNISIYSSSNGTEWTQITNASEARSLNYCVIDNKSEYIWRVDGVNLYRTQNGLEWELYKTYDIELGNRLYIDSKGIFYTWKYSDETTPLRKSFDLENWETITVENNRFISVSLTVFANVNNIVYISASSHKYIFYNDNSEKKMILPTKKDKTNQVYGYINSEE